MGLPWPCCNTGSGCGKVTQEISCDSEATVLTTVATPHQVHNVPCADTFRRCTIFASHVCKDWPTRTALASKYSYPVWSRDVPWDSSGVFSAVDSTMLQERVQGHKTIRSAKCQQNSRALEFGEVWNVSEGSKSVSTNSKRPVANSHHLLVEPFFVVLLDMRWPGSGD